MKRNIALFFIVIVSSFVAVQPAFAQEHQQLPTLVLISNVNIFDGKTEKLHKNMHVLVAGNRIEQISSEPLAVIQTDNVTIINGGGRTLMPGMIEGHGHVMFASNLPKFLNQDEYQQGISAARRANDYLMSGFTTIRDCGGNSFGVKRALDADIFPGPRIYPAGASIGQTSGHGDFRSNTDGHPYFDGKDNGGVVNRWRHTLIADGVDEVRRAVREQLFRGASHIKLHTGGGVTSFTDPLMAAQYAPERFNII